MLAALILASCGDEQKLDVKHFEASDSTEYCVLHINASLPTSDGPTSENVRNALLEVLRTQMNLLTLDENKELVGKQAVQNGTDVEEAVSAYGKDFFGVVGKRAEEMHNEQMAYLDSIGEPRPTEILPWSYEIAIHERKDLSTDRFLVFTNGCFSFMGGAHGSITGEGPMVFDANTGERFKKFLKERDSEALRQVLLDGIVEFFNGMGVDATRDNIGDYLLYGKEKLTAPVQDPLPTRNGLLFQYQSYEVAAYAAGMPEFLVSYEKIRPFLTDEAVALLGLE